MNRALNARVPWLELIRQELLPFHGRLAGSLRTMLAAAIAVTATMIFHLPAAAPGVFMIFLVSYETPYLTFTSGLYSLIFQVMGAVAALLLVIATDNDPMARVLGMALFSFMTGFLLRTMRRRGAMDFGVFALNTLALWDLHRPPEQLVRLAMWPAAVGAIGVMSAVAIEYCFARRDPYYALDKEFEERILAVENYLHAYAGDDGAPHLSLAAHDVLRFSLAGQGRMLALLDEISNRREGPQEYTRELHLLLPHLFRVLDRAASLTLDENAAAATPERRARARRLAAACALFRQDPLLQATPPADDLFPSAPDADSGDPLAQLEHALADLRNMTPHAALSLDASARVKQPAPPWFVADMWTEPAYLIFGLKISFCCTLGYIIYMALNWPGISTCVITVLVTGLNTTGAISQKLIFRFVGSFLGGVILGIGSIIFLFPHMDTITSFVLLVCAVSFLASWIARSPHFSYIGMQIAFSFFLIALGTYSAPVDMTPARDRLIGLGLALLLVWVMFLEINPTRTVAEMRTALAQILANQARLLAVPESHGRDKLRAAERLRDGIARDLVGVRSMSELVPYEFSSRSDMDREQHADLLELSLAAGSLFLALEAWRHQDPDAPFAARNVVAQSLAAWSRQLASSIVTLQEHVPPGADQASLPARVAAARANMAACMKQLCPA
ncbi:MAG: FUSC family protein [Acidobacteriota bacterium]|nr:FUSC family protein [Acidobacteriota bacterium]